MMEIDPQTVYFLILKAREFDDKDSPGEADPDASPADADPDANSADADADANPADANSAACRRCRSGHQI